MNKIYCFLIALMFFACQSKENTSSINSSDKLVEFAIDSTRLANIFADTTLKEFDGNEVTFLMGDLPDSTFGYSLNEGIRLDSIKKTGTLNKYLEKIDIGMLTKVKFIKFKEFDLAESKFQLWGMASSTYEACPYAINNVMFLSTIKSSKLVSCIPIAYDNYWADAPFWSSEQAKVSFTSKDTIVHISGGLKNGGIDEKDKDFTEIREFQKYYTLNKNGVFELKK